MNEEKYIVEVQELTRMIEFLVDEEYNIKTGEGIEIDIEGFISDNQSEFTIEKNDILIELINDGYWVRATHNGIYLIKPNV